MLTARRRTGAALPAWESTTSSQFPEAQNRKLVRFQVFSNTDFTSSNLLCDAFGNTDIAVLVDKDLDGVIKAGSDFDPLPLVGGIRPADSDFPAAGIRAGIVFYAPAPGASVDRPEFIFSWK